MHSLDLPMWNRFQLNPAEGPLEMYCMWPTPNGNGLQRTSQFRCTYGHAPLHWSSGTAPGWHLDDWWVSIINLMISSTYLSPEARKNLDKLFCLHAQLTQFAQCYLPLVSNQSKQLLTFSRLISRTVQNFARLCFCCVFWCALTFDCRNPDNHSNLAC